MTIKDKVENWNRGRNQLKDIKRVHIISHLNSHFEESSQFVADLTL